MASSKMVHAAPVKIVTDTGCDLPPAVVEQYDIQLVPLVLRFGERDVADTPETRQELWQRVDAGLPCETSGPPVGAYEAAYRPLVEAGYHVVNITLTGAHSVTYNSAWTAAQSFPGQVEVIDGKSVSLGYGLQVLKAAQLAQAGADAAAVSAVVRDLQSRITIRFFLETLEQVKRGGRLDALIPVLSRLGQALNIRGILTVNDEGRITLVGPSRGRRGAINRLIQDAAATAPVEQAIVAHARSADEASEIAAELAQRLDLPLGDILIAEIGAVLIAHAGSGVLGVGTVRAPARQAV